jgi:hypothetical protein
MNRNCVPSDVPTTMFGLPYPRSDMARRCPACRAEGPDTQTHPVLHNAVVGVCLACPTSRSNVPFNRLGWARHQF